MIMLTVRIGPHRATAATNRLLIATANNSNLDESEPAAGAIIETSNPTMKPEHARNLHAGTALASL